MQELQAKKIRKEEQMQDNKRHDNIWTHEKMPQTCSQEPEITKDEFDEVFSLQIPSISILTHKIQAFHAILQVTIFIYLQQTMQGNQNFELKKKFERKQTFYHEMEGISKKFFEFQQQVFYSPVKDINPKMIIKVEGKSQQRAIFKRQDFYLINGQYQPTGERSFEKLILQIVQTIPRPSRSFGIIYINTFAPGDAYNDFKKVMELLPFQYLSNLTKVYVLQASFMNKAFFWLSFGTVTNYIKNKTVNVDTLKELEKLAHFQPDLLKKILPSNVFEELSKYEAPKEVSRMNLRTQPVMASSHVQQQEHSHPQNPKYSSAIFGSTVESPKKSNKKLITDYQLGPTGAPKILQLLIYYFKNRQESLKTEGIFRKSVSIDDETQILLELENKNYNFLETVENPHIIANALKRFLSNLRVPIISYELFEMLMASDNKPNYVQIVIETIQNLPKINKMSIFLLFSFIRKVILYSQHNKMGENNICIVFGPCLLRAEISSIKDLIYAKKVIVATSIIYQQFQVIFGDLHQRNLLKRNSYIEYRKDQIMQKINRSPQSSKKTEQFEQEQPILLDRTSQFIKEALQEKQQNNYYLQTAETEEAIKDIPSPSAKTVEKYHQGKVEQIIDVVIHPEESQVHSVVRKGGPKSSEFAQI